MTLENRNSRSKGMGSGDDDQPPPQPQPQPLLSSLVVRPSNTDGGSNFDPGCDPSPPYSRSARFPDDPGYRVRAGSASPVHRRDADHRYDSDYNHLSRSHGGSGRDIGRYRDTSPPYGRGRVGSRPIRRAFDRPSFVPGPVRGDGISRNNPNVRPREGDWICPDPVCGNLNFARRDYCNNCNRPRYARAGSPRRAYPGPPSLHAPPRRFPGPSIGRTSERTMNGYRSPSRGFARDGPEDYGSAALPPFSHEGRFPDPHLHRERMDYIEDSYRRRNRFDRSPPVDLGYRHHGRDDFSHERTVFERQPQSRPPPLLPSLPPHRSPWDRDVRERSRSPIRGGPPPKDYRQDMYMDRIRDDGRGVGRDRIRGMH